MHIAIIGAGGIGGFLAARLLSVGQDVSILARGAHLEAIREGGLRLIEPEGEILVHPPKISADPGDIGDADLVICAVKGPQMGQAAAIAGQWLKPDGVALPFQNGVGATEALAKEVGAHRALVGIAKIFCNITAPGVLTRYGGPGAFIFGDHHGSQDTDKVSEIRSALDLAGVDAPRVADVNVALWEKFLLFSAASSMTAGARCRFGQIREDPDMASAFRHLVAEAYAVALARGVALEQDSVERTVEILQNLPAEGRTSMAHDVELGKPLELDSVGGALLRMGRESGVPTPYTHAFVAALTPFKEGSGG